MKRFLFSFLLVIALALPFSMKAQTLDTIAIDMGIRASVGVDKMIVKGLHVSLQEEARIDNLLGDRNRLQTTLSVNYKFHTNFKAGLGYALINGFDTSADAFKPVRHRLMVDVKGTLIWGDWNISLKERIQLTHRTGDYNMYEHPANALVLKSRLTFKYADFDSFEPYLSLEMSNRLNAPRIEASFDGENYYTLDTNEQEGEPGWFLKGFNRFSINRLRAVLGGDVKINRHNTLNVYVMGDLNADFNVDANASGTILEDYSIGLELAARVGVSYMFSF